ncbi:hypothetical protein [Plantibacter sp. lyk4-40-MEA-4]|uniref:hypothetical protein n=1 Tax=Plantibacter sp. lyk4-40-MEA-4 TaxID=3040298 RepID=UPI00254BC955|nr:hypothetical protein [Plantibacter sp. lyk4-40-MEA-4]
MSMITSQYLTAGDESLERWRVSGREASIVAWSNLVGSLGRDELHGAGVDEAVVVPASDTIELVIGSTCDWSSVADGVVALQEVGWSVTVLTALHSLGAAHHVLAGTDVHLQGCWRNDTGWSFTPAEIA